MRSLIWPAGIKQGDKVDVVFLQNECSSSFNVASVLHRDFNGIICRRMEWDRSVWKGMQIACAHLVFSSYALNIKRWWVSGGQNQCSWFPSKSHTYFQQVNAAKLYNCTEYFKYVSASFLNRYRKIQKESMWICLISIQNQTLWVAGLYWDIRIMFWRSGIFSCFL